MFILGLTGKTGAGKSTISELLSNYGCFIIDGDRIAHEILEAGSPVIDSLADAFGADIKKYNGETDRKLLAQRAFDSRENTGKLNSITHPVIRSKIREQIDQAEKDGYKTCVVDAAALLDSSCRNDCEKIAVVFAPSELRLKRIIKRDDLSVTEAKQRMDAQKSDEFYLENADIIIINDDETDFESEMQKLYNFIDSFNK